MRGHVRKRGKTWAVVVDVGRDPETGQRRQKWHSGYATKRAAERDLADIVSRLDRGAYIEPARTTVAEWCDLWLTTQRSRLRPATWESYRDTLRRVTINVGHIPLQALTAARVDQLYAQPPRNRP